MDSKILLENGTNELEVLEFTLGGNSYGINVAKIREIITYQEVTPVPNAHPSIEGIFMPRDTMITAIDLKNCLQMGTATAGGLFIVTNFNKLDIAFHVDSVVGIHRVSWTDIIRPDATVTNKADGVSTGIIKVNGKLIIILDFEKIITDINPETGLKITEIEELGYRDRYDVPILIAEDSVLLNKLIVESLRQAGYENLIHTENGQEAYDVICQCKAEGTLKQKIQCIITDIEMPVMTGLELAKKINEINNSTKIVFVTGFKEYAYDAFKVNAIGYVLKPYDDDTVFQEIEKADAFKNTTPSNEIAIKTFGYFDIFVNRKPVYFSSAKAKEFMALLVDRQGSSVSTEQAVSILWPDRDYDESVQSLFRKVLRSLRNSLSDAGILDVLIDERNQRSIDTTKFKCDYYQFLTDPHRHFETFHGEYMTGYAFAKPTEQKIKNKFYEVKGVN